MPEWLELIDWSTLGSVVVALAFGVWVVRKAWPFIRRLTDFLDDLMGEAARPGVPERPGLMVRVERLEGAAAQAVHNTQPNGGESAYDNLARSVRDLRDDVARVRATGEATAAAVADLGPSVKRLDKRVSSHVTESKAWVQAVKAVDPSTPDWPDT